MSALKVIGGAVAGFIVGIILFFTLVAATQDRLNNRSFVDHNDGDLVISMFACCGAVVGALAAVAQTIEQRGQPTPLSTNDRNRELMN